MRQCFSGGGRRLIGGTWLSFVWNVRSKKHKLINLNKIRLHKNCSYIIIVMKHTLLSKFFALFKSAISFINDQDKAIM